MSTKQKSAFANRKMLGRAVKDSFVKTWKDEKAAAK